MRISRRSGSPTLLLLATLGGCGAGTELPLAPSLASPVRTAAGVTSSHASTPLPWNGRCEFAAERLGPTLIRVSGACQLTHLGRVTFVDLQTLVPGPVTQFTNTTTYTAANGDLLHTTAVGTATPAAGGSRLIGSATETVTGGTGRFAHATGHAAFASTVFLTGAAAGTGLYELTGTMNYTASDRAP